MNCFKNSGLLILFFVFTTMSMELSKHSSPAVSTGNEAVTFKDCMSLAQMAIETDSIYHLTQDLINRKKIEQAYVKALSCFIETYEKNKSEGSIQVIKMWKLLLQIESEQKQTDENYQLPKEISELRKKVEALGLEKKRDLSKKKIIFERELYEISRESLYADTLHSLSKLKQEMETLIEEGSIIIPKDKQDDDTFIRRQTMENHESRCPEFDQGTQVLLQANKLLSTDLKDQTSQNIELYGSAQENYRRALTLFIEAYKKQKTNLSFAQIHKTLDYMIRIEQLKRTKQGAQYKIPEHYQELLLNVQCIKEQEVERCRKKNERRGSPSGSLIQKN